VTLPFTIGAKIRRPIAFRDEAAAPARGRERQAEADRRRPGKPTDNGFQKMEDWRRDYNEVRPHSAIGNKAPISLLNGSSAPPRA